MGSFSSYFWAGHWFLGDYLFLGFPDGPSVFFLGEVTKWAKWFEGKISGWMLTDDRTNKN